MSDPDPQVRRAIISWEEVRAWSRGGQPEPANPPARGWRRLDLDGVFAFALFLPILFGASFGGLTAAIFVGLTFAYATVRAKALWRILAPRAFLLIPAAFAIASWRWSELPDESLRQGLALLLTLTAGLLLSAAQSPGAVFRGVTAAYLIYLIVSRALGVSMTGGMGDIGASSALIALGVVVMAIRQRSWPWALFGAIAAAFEVSALAQARPAGAVLGLAVAVAVIALLAAAVKGRGWVRALAALTATAGVAAAAINARLIARWLTDHGRGWIAANPNLDRISDGWDQARALIAGQRLLGKGFYALWPSETVAAARAATVAAVSAGQPQPQFVHNSYIDILLQLGWVGLWIFGATLLIGTIIFLRRFIVRPNLALALWGGVLAYQVVRVQVDVVGYQPFFPSALLLSAALAAAFSPELAPRPARRQPPPPPLPPASVVHIGEFRTRKTEKADPAFRHPDRPS